MRDFLVNWGQRGISGTVTPFARMLILVTVPELAPGIMPSGGIQQLLRLAVATRNVKEANVVEFESEGLTLISSEAVEFDSLVDRLAPPGIKK